MRKVEIDMKLMEISERVILWNSQRYDQVYDYELASKLLLEEIEELFTATSDVEKMDAIGDITFVAIGVFWKAGLTPQHIKSIFEMQDLTLLDMIQLQDWAGQVEYEIMENVDQSIPALYPGISLACHATFIIALGYLRAMGMQEYFYDIVHAICDSNATKEIKGKTAANIKANVVKGAGFVPPTEMLLGILAHHQTELKKRVVQ